MRSRTSRPCIEIYAGDWFRDHQLRQCSVATRGVWVDLLLYMSVGDRTGEITGTPDRIARAVGVTVDELLAALRELDLTKAADVTLGHNDVTVINRRMRAEWRERRKAAARKAKQRSKQRQGALFESADQGNVTDKSRSDLYLHDQNTDQSGVEGEGDEAARIAAYRGHYGANAVARERGRRPPISEVEDVERRLRELVEGDK